MVLFLKQRLLLLDREGRTLEADEESSQHLWVESPSESAPASAAGWLALSPVLPPQLRAPKRTRGWGRFCFGGTLRKDGGVPPFGGRSRNPGATENQRRNKPRARAPASKRPQDHASPGPPSRRAAGPWGSGAPHHRASPEERRVPADSQAVPWSLPPLGLHPRRSSRSGSLTMHQSPHVLVSSPQVCAGLGGAAGRRRGGRGARGARAVGAGTRGAATWAGGRGRGGSRPAVVSARHPAPSGRPQPRTRHARCAPPAQPSALRPVRRPSDCAPATVASCSLTAAGQWARRAEPVRQWARPSAPAGREVPGEAGQGGLPGPFPQSPERSRSLRPPAVSAEAMAALSVLLPGGRNSKNGRPREAPDGQGLERRGPECCGSTWDPQSSFSLSALRSSRPFLHLLSSRPQILRPFPHF